MKILSRRTLYLALATSLLLPPSVFAPPYNSDAQAQSLSGNQSKTVYIVRHANKGTPPDEYLDGSIFENPENCGKPNTGDTLLTEKGMKRAHDLAHTLQNEGMRHIYVTNYSRTQQTAQFFANDKDIRPKIVCFSFRELDDYVARTKANVLALQNGDVLIVAHSPAIIPLVKELGTRVPDDMTFEKIEKCFNYMFVITGVTDEPGLPVLYRYGDPNSVCTAGTPWPD